MRGPLPNSDGELGVLHGDDDGDCLELTTTLLARENDALAVEDDGPGMPPDIRDEALDSGFTTAGEGTGLGLAIVARIAERHGWTLEINRRSRRGRPLPFEGVEMS